MAFGQQSGPPASGKQVDYLLTLLKQEGHTSFRDARGPMGFTQRQAGGKFTVEEAAAFIDTLENGADDAATDGERVLSPAQRLAADRLEAQRAEMISGIPAELLASELERRGWCVIAPPPSA